MIRTKVRRDPVRRINCYRGDFSDPANPQGLGNKWRYDVDDATAVQWLIDQILTAYAAGFLVFVINRWTGECQNQGAIIASEAWNTLPESRRAALMAIFKPWWDAFKAADPRVELWLYVSNMIRDDHDATQLCPGSHTHAPVMTDPADIAYQHLIWDHLVSLGFDGLIADNAATPEKQESSEDQYDAWQADFFDRPIGFTVEGIPRESFLPDEPRLLRQPAAAFWRFVRSNEQDSGQTWTFDATAMDVIVFITDDERTDEEEDAELPAVVATRAQIKTLMQNGARIGSCSTTFDAWAVGLARAANPTNVHAAWTETGLSLAWDHAVTVDELGQTIGRQFYEILRREHGSGDPFEQIGTTVADSYLDEDADPDLEYDYQVRTFTDNNAASWPDTVTTGDDDGGGGADDEEDLTGHPRRYVVPLDDRGAIWHGQAEDDMVTKEKDPGEVLDYPFDFSRVLANGETIVGSSWARVAEPEDDDDPAEVDSSSYTTTSTTVWISGGTNKEQYVFRNSVVTSAGRTYRRRLRLSMTER